MSALKAEVSFLYTAYSLILFFLFIQSLCAFGWLIQSIYIVFVDIRMNECHIINCLQLFCVFIVSFPLCFCVSFYIDSFHGGISEYPFLSFVDLL